MSMFGKMTGFKDGNGKNVYEFDRIRRRSDNAEATVIYRDYPSNEHVKPYALNDDGSFCTLTNFGSFDIIINQEANQRVCKQYDYRRTLK